jgi:hypothetical protein
MAKKARKKLEEASEPPFEFPEFDESSFVWKELEMDSATLLAGLITIVVGVASSGVTLVGLPWFAAFLVGLAGIIGGLYGIRRLRPASHAYTKGDWAQLFMLEFFGWLAIWFVLVQLLGGPSG